MTRLAVALVTLATPLAFAASADAARIGLANAPDLGTVLQFEGGGGRDVISITHTQPGTFEYSSATTEVEPLAGCTPTSLTAGTCSGQIAAVLAFGEGGSDDITLSLCALGAGTGCAAVVPGGISGGAGDDTLIGNVVSAFESQLLPEYSMAGGEGNDRLDGASGADELYGEAGNDVLQGRDGADLVDGGPGDDELSAEDTRDAADTYVGGDGFDKITSSLDFGEGDGEVAVSLDGSANDGGPGEGDNVMGDVERVDAYGRHVTLVGSEGPNELRSFGTTSLIQGLGGDDRLLGWDGADTIAGGAGNDFLQGGFGADVLDGGPGLDEFMGDQTERDVIATGNDEIRARDGVAEQVNCGIGSDRAIVDAIDIVDSSCESVDRGAPQPGPPAPPPPSPGSVEQQLAFRVAGRPTLRKLLRGGMSFSLTCPTACKVSAELRMGKRRVGSGRASLRAARAGAVRVRLSKAGKRPLRRLRRATLVLRVRVTAADGSTSTITRTLRLKR
jgi:hypothetical protein